MKFLSQKVKEDEGFESPLGQSTWKKDKLAEHTHHGSMANYESVVRYFKNENLIIAILTNQENSNVYEISNRIHKLTKE